LNLLDSLQLVVEVDFDDRILSNTEDCNCALSDVSEDLDVVFGGQFLPLLVGFLLSWLGVQAHSAGLIHSHSAESN